MSGADERHIAIFVWIPVVIDAKLRICIKRFSISFRILSYWHLKSYTPPRAQKQPAQARKHQR